MIWPWTGWMAVSVEVKESAQEWRGVAEGIITAVIETVPEVSCGFALVLTLSCA